MRTLFLCGIVFFAGLSCTFGGEKEGTKLVLHWSNAIQDNDDKQIYSDVVVKKLKPDIPVHNVPTDFDISIHTVPTDSDVATDFDISMHSVPTDFDVPTDYDIPVHNVPTDFDISIHTKPTDSDVATDFDISMHSVPTDSDIPVHNVPRDFNTPPILDFNGITNNIPYPGTVLKFDQESTRIKRRDERRNVKIICVIIGIILAILSAICRKFCCKKESREADSVPEVIVISCPLKPISTCPQQTEMTNPPANSGPSGRQMLAFLLSRNYSNPSANNNDIPPQQNGSYPIDGTEHNSTIKK